MVTGGNKPFDATASALSEVQSVTYVSGSDRWEMAEREGFEPPIGLHLCRISSAVHSTTLPPLQAPWRVTCTAAVGPCSGRGRRARQGAAQEFAPPAQQKRSKNNGASDGSRQRCSL